MNGQTIIRQSDRFTCLSIKGLAGALVIVDEDTGLQSNPAINPNQKQKILALSESEFYNYSFNKVYNRP